MNEFVRTKDEQEIVECLSQNKLKSITKEEAETLIEIVGKWGFYLGVAKNLHSDDILLLCRFIKDTYPDLTLAELNLAMSLYMKRKIVVEFYGQLSPIFISNLLNNYMDYRKENLRDVFYRAETKSVPVETPKQSKEEEHKMLTDAILYEYQKYKDGKEVDDFFSIIYDFLKRTNRLNPTEKVVKQAEENANRCFENDKYQTAQTIGDIIKKTYNRDEQTAKKKHFQNFILVDLFSKINDINSFILSIKLDEIE